MRFRIRLREAEEQVEHINPLPTWFRLDRSNISHLERLIYDDKGNVKNVTEDMATVSKWIDGTLCWPGNKSTGLKRLCAECGSTPLWDCIKTLMLHDKVESRIVVLYLLHEVKLEMVKHMIEYLVEKRNELDIKDWFILVGYFFDRCKKLNVYSSSSLEMHMPDNLFNMLLKEQIDKQSLLRYADLFYHAMCWFAIEGRSYDPKYRIENKESIAQFEQEGGKIYNKIHRIKSIQKKFFSHVRRTDKELYRSIYSQTCGRF